MVTVTVAVFGFWTWHRCPDPSEHPAEVLTCRLLMMLLQQQMGYDAVQEFGEYDPGIDSLSISEDSSTYTVCFLEEILACQ